MPVTWCYLVEDGSKYCSRGFPLGCYVTKNGVQKDACVMSVSNWLSNITCTVYL